LIFGDLVGRFDELEDRVLASQGARAAFEELLAAREVIKALHEPLRRKKTALVSIREQEMPFVTDDTQRLFTQNLEADLEMLWQGFLRLRSWWDVLLDIHRTTVGQRTSRVIYVLTILSAVFLPITFISSVYGMREEIVDTVAQRTPVPTATPGPVERLVEEMAEESGLAGQSFLGLSTKDWIDLGLSSLLVVGILLGFYLSRSQFQNKDRVRCVLWYGHWPVTTGCRRGRARG
jgi:hypothetical protein